jgi:hypothetical protein
MAQEHQAPPLDFQHVLEPRLRITGLRADGPLRESYIRFGADQRGYQSPARFLAKSEADFKTELQQPVN